MATVILTRLNASAAKNCNNLAIQSVCGNHAQYPAVHCVLPAVAKNEKFFFADSYRIFTAILSRIGKCPVSIRLDITVDHKLPILRNEHRIARNSGDAAEKLLPVNAVNDSGAGDIILL